MNTLLEKLFDASFYYCSLNDPRDQNEVMRLLKKLLPSCHHITFGQGEWAAYDVDNRKIAYAFDNERTVETHFITY